MAEKQALAKLYARGGWWCLSTPVDRNRAHELHIHPLKAGDETEKTLMKCNCKTMSKEWAWLCSSISQTAKLAFQYPLDSQEAREGKRGGGSNMSLIVEPLPFQHQRRRPYRSH
jgi:hypothetical protein